MTIKFDVPVRPSIHCTIKRNQPINVGWGRGH